MSRPLPHPAAVLFVCLVAAAGCSDPDDPRPVDPVGETPVDAPPPPPALVPDDAPKPGSGSPPPAAPSVAVAVEGQMAVAAAVPQGEVNGLVRPTITFDRPVRALGATGGEAPASIEPAIPGEWRWLGSSTVEFVPEKPAPLATVFTVRVPGGLTALDGTRLADEYRYTFETARPRPISGSPVNAWNDFALVRADQPFAVIFDQPLVEETLSAGIVIRGPKADTPVKIVAVERLADEAGGAGNSISADRRVRVRFEPVTPLALDAAHELVFTPALKSAQGPLTAEGEVAWKFRTYPPLTVSFIGCKSWSGRCPDGPLSIWTSTPVTAGALKKALTIDPAVKIAWPDDEKLERSRWVLSGDFGPERSYAVVISGLVDTFGQTVERHPGTFRTGSYEPSLGAPDDAALIEKGLRAALPVTHVNLDGVQLGFARLDPVEALPWLEQPWRKETPDNLRWSDKALGGARNVRLRSPIDLDPLFDAEPGEKAGRLALVRLKWKEGKYDRSSSTLVQISDLGAHLKVSPRDSAVWAWHLTDGRPAEGAVVTVFDAAGKELARGTAGADGVARLPGIDGMDLPKKNKWGGNLYGPPFVAARVALGDDVAVLTTRDTWAFSAYRFGLDSAWENSPPRAEGLVFTDRGIYRPGEKVYVKGILRTRSLGELQTPAGRAVELKLLDPEGQTVAERKGTLSRFGGVQADFDLPADGRLGSWSVSVRDPADDLSWYASFRMAEYRAPAFLVEVTPAAEARYAGEPVEANIEGRYLFGAAMSGAEASWSMSAAPGRFEPKDADGFVFGKRFSWWDDDDTSEKVVAGGVMGLDDAGRLTVEAGPAETPQNRPQMYTVEARVTDVDRQEIAGRTTFPVHPASHYVGLKGPAGFAVAKTPFEVQIVARDAVGEQRVAVPEVSVKLMRHQWNTVKKKNAWGAFETVSEKEEIEVTACTVGVSADSAATCTIAAPESGYHELVATSKDAAGRTTTTTDGLWVSGPGYAAWLRDDDNKVEVVADRATYDVGDTARLLVQSPYPEAEAWVTVERAGILSQQRVRLRGTATPIEIPITEDMIPNAFVGVVLTRGRVDRPGKPGDPGRPSFRVGYRELRVMKAQKRLSVKLTPDAAEKRPGDALSIDVAVTDRAGQGVESEVTVWAVDKGVLALTGYRTPDPIEALYRPRGLSVRQVNNLTTLIAQLDYGEKGRDAGGGGGGADAMELRKNFVTTPIFVGDAVTDARGKATVEGTLPDNLTTFTLMAVAVTAADRAGSGESEVVVTKPLLARPALPRAARTGDVFAAGAVIHRRGDSPARITVTAAAEGPIKAVGALERTLTIPPNKGVEVRFGFEASAPGDAKLRFTVSDGTHQDGVEMTVPVRSPVRMETVAVYGETEAERTEALSVPPARAGQGGLELTLASTALGGMTDAAEMLVDYPYGCLEQRASRLVPFVALKSVLDQYAQPWLGERQPAEVVAENVKAIAQLQRPDGGFGYWPGAWRSNYWATAYATLALGEAEAAGYAITGIDLAAARRFLRTHFTQPQPGFRSSPSREARAFALYVLARHDAAERGLENQLYGEREGMALFGRALLATAMASGPGADKARTLLAGIMNQARVDADAVHFAEDDPETYAPLFHSDTRTTAIVLQTFLALDPTHVFVPKIARYLQSVRTGGGYRTTQEAGFSLLAMADYARVREAQTPDFVARVKLGSKAIAEKPFKGRSLASETVAVPMAELGTDAGQRPMVFSAEGTGRLYYGARLQYAPQDMPTDARDAGLIVQRWYTLDGRGADAVEAVTEGTLVRVHLRVASHQERHYVAIEDPLPAGLEPVDTSLETTGRMAAVDGADPDPEDGSETLDGRMMGWYSPFDHVETRDDRVLLFADRLAPGVHSYSYVARATTAGTFQRPPARAEEMYTPEVSGRSTGGRFWVHPRAELSAR